MLFWGCMFTTERKHVKYLIQLTCTIKVDIAVVFLANIAQCKAVFPCAASVKFGDAPRVNSNRVGSRLLIFQQDHINGVIPPRSSESGLTPRATKYATKAVWPYWAAKWMQEQPSASRNVGSAPVIYVKPISLLRNFSKKNQYSAIWCNPVPPKPATLKADVSETHNTEEEMALPSW